MSILEKLHIYSDNSGAFAGKWLEMDGKTFPSFNPTTEELLAKIMIAKSDDYEMIVKHCEQAFKTWREVPAPKRGEVVREIANELRKYKDVLGSLVAMEVGKIKSEGDGEVQEMIDIADFAVGQSRMLYGKTMHSERFRHRMYEQWHPLGPIGIITAFNFPVAVWAWNALIAAICGNTVIWKPSPKAALCALAVQNICNQVFKRYDYPNVFSLFITDNNDLVNKMVEDKRLPLISFTGSSAVGRIISEKVGRRLGKCLLELSGNNAMIVTEHADLNKAIPSIVFGAVGTAGQRCTSTRRVIVHKSRFQGVINKLVSAYQSVKHGNPLEEGVLLGPLVDKAAVMQFEKTIAEAKKLGGEILYGGNVIEGKGFFVEPTIIKAQHDWSIVQRETFAPILYVIPYETLDEAIAIHNNVGQGLSSAIFTDNLQEAEQFLSAIGSDCGIANVNIGTSGAEIGGAFGGEKDTGGGREAGSDAWQAYMRRQTNTINWSDELPLAQGVEFKM